MFYNGNKKETRPGPKRHCRARDKVTERCAPSAITSSSSFPPSEYQTDEMNLKKIILMISTCVSNAVVLTYDVTML